MDNLGSLKIDKLAENNYHIWRQKVELLLSFKELGDHIKENDTDQGDHQDPAKWTRDNAKAMAVIGLTINDEYLEMVSECKTAISMWKTVKDVFQKSTLLNRLHARRKFYSVKMGDNERILSYISRAQQLSSDLKSMDVVVSEEDVAMTLLRGFSSRFEHLIVAIDTLSVEGGLNLDFVKSRLIQEEQRMSDRDVSGTSTTDAALVHNPRALNRGRKFCKYCRKTNHTEVYCWKKQMTRKRKRRDS